MDDPTYIFDIEVYEKYGHGVWAQAKYLVHGLDDVLWTNDSEQAALFIKRSIEAANNRIEQTLRSAAHPER